jgi:hypothetical protein
MHTPTADPSIAAPPAVDPLFLATPGITTCDGGVALTNASGFFFRRGERLFLVTSRHVLIDQPSNHRPSRLSITLHLDARNLSRYTEFSMPVHSRLPPGLSRHRVPAAGAAPRRHRLTLRCALPGPGLLSHRRAHPPRHQRGAGGDASPAMTREGAPLPWQLLGVHSARMDMGNRDRVQDESLGLNCAWYADILLTLTA